MFCKGCNYYLPASKKAVYCGLGKDCWEVDIEKECFDKVPREDKELTIEFCSKYDFYTKNNIEQVPKFFRTYLESHPECTLVYYSVKRDVTCKTAKSYRRVVLTLVTRNCDLARLEMLRMFEEHYEHSLYAGLATEDTVNIYTIHWYEYLRTAYETKQKRRHRKLSY